MADSLSGWLALREPADTAARLTAGRALSVLTAAVMRNRSGPPLRIVDLAAGTGSNLRYLAGRLPVGQEWLLVDHDQRLLAEVPRLMASWAATHGCGVAVDPDRTVVRGNGVSCDVETRCLDLNAPGRLDLFSNRHLVTASALLDLVSDEWLRAVAAQCRHAGAAALFTLTYTGMSHCTPAEPEDDMVLELFNSHQARDKGLGGPAAGPDAVNAAERAFRPAGYEIQRESSDWKLLPEQRELQRQLITGWANAAAEVAPDASRTIDSWLARRLSHLDAGRSHVTVSHEDFAAWPLDS